ncbi:leucyl aminopeptidase [Romboutsia sp.]|uniref:leucyl aminopeptidase n=1 Tax=Romboutsia sp. TaxID=1965302 RepID=UPI003F2D55AB
MKILLKNKMEISKYDGIIIPIYEDKLKVDITEIPLEQLKESNKFEGKENDLYKLTILEEGKLVEVVLVGLGKKDKLSYRKILNILGESYRLLKNEKVSNFALVLDANNVDSNEQLVRASVESFIMSDYKFDHYKKKERSSEEPKVDIIVNEIDKYENIKKEAATIALANLISRKLVNEPANILNPKTLSKEVEHLGKEKGFEVEILKLKEIEKLGMESFLSVAKGSDIEPRFIIMRYIGNKDSDQILGYVGKGLTYDSGGLSIKPTSGMVDMKSDMAGAAAVIGAMCAISENKLNTNVVGVIAACENMISGNSYRPGDIINSMGGKTIFIGNTDAEGRLTLIDAMEYIVTKEKVTKVLDIATLTGAALHCTGAAASVAISNNDEFYKKVNESFDFSGEQIWRMPVFDEYKELIKHHEADLTNTAGNPGTITAGLFIGEFNGDLPWVHIDIAGTSLSTKEKGILSKGATGIATRPLYYLAKEQQK